MSLFDVLLIQLEILVDVCDTQASSSYASSACPKVRNQFFECTRKNINCQEIWTNTMIDAPSDYCFPPRYIPKFLESNYTYGGTIEVQYAYYDDLKLPHSVGRNQVRTRKNHNT